jgi:hypothetical protein
VPEPEDRSPLDLLCDLLVYAPVGFAFEAPKLLPELATKGRDQVAAARSVGQFVVRQAGTRLGPLVGSMLSGVLAGLVREDGDGTAGDAEPTGPADTLPAPVGEVAATDGPAPSEGATLAVSAAVASDAGDVPGVEELAIPHYDSLAASQVVGRLAALSDDELEAVAAYELAHRGRRTIMNRTEQLLGRARGRA